MGKADDLLRTMGGTITESASHRGAPAVRLIVSGSSSVSVAMRRTSCAAVISAAGSLSAASSIPVPASVRAGGRPCSAASAHSSAALPVPRAAASMGLAGSVNSWPIVPWLTPRSVPTVPSGAGHGESGGPA